MGCYLLGGMWIFAGRHSVGFNVGGAKGATGWWMMDDGWASDGEPIMDDDAMIMVQWIILLGVG